MTESKGSSSFDTIATETTFQAILCLPGNDCCFECGKRAPDWASLGFGILICLECAGRHRSLGVHVTLVRSLNLDSWSIDYLALLRHGGNDLFRHHLTSYAASAGIVPCSTKYLYPEILYYREILSARVENREPKVFVREDYVELISSAVPVVQPKATTAPTWGKDKDIARCLLCNSVFNLLNRRHHCRRCGKCVCATCAPKKNARPIMEWGLREPVRHCRVCYQSPMIKWGPQPEPPIITTAAAEEVHAKSYRNSSQES